MKYPTPVASDRIDFLSLLAEPKRNQLLEGSRRVRYPAGSLAYAPDEPDYAVIVGRGLIRLYVGTRSGRQATIHYIHPSELMSWGLAPRPSIKVHVQAVTDAMVTSLDVDMLRRQASVDPDISKALWTYMAALEATSTRIIAVRSLGDITERLAFDLLDRACASQLESGELMVRATQQQLADSIGSVREVVARALRKLRDDRIITTAPNSVRVVDVRRLENILTRALI
jgi:CRP/FNR family cyclic AMP-dependent transcriptional regulator